MVTKILTIPLVLVGLLLFVYPTVVSAACDFSETESNGNFVSANVVPIDCVGTQSGLEIIGRVNDSSDVDVYKIPRNFNKGDIIEAVYSLGGDKSLATGIFRPDGNLLIINNHRNVFRGRVGPTT